MGSTFGWTPWTQLTQTLQTHQLAMRRGAVAAVARRPPRAPLLVQPSHLPHLKLGTNSSAELTAEDYPDLFVVSDRCRELHSVI